MFIFIITVKLSIFQKNRFYNTILILHFSWDQKDKKNWLLEISKLEKRILFISKLFPYYPLYAYCDMQHILVERKFIWDRKQAENQ